MWLLSLTLVLLSAGLHASWNLIVKSGDDKLICAWSTVLAAPLVLSPLLWVTGLPPREAWGILFGSGVIHAVYNVALAQAYECGDLSVVYPVARGLAPLGVALAAPFVLGETLSPSAGAAVALIGGGIVWLGVAGGGTGTKASALGWATLTAALIATYSIVDKVGVLRSNPLAYAVVLFCCNALVMTPYVVLRRGPRRIGEVWRRRWVILVASGLFSVGAYLLVLIAMRLTQVSYVAALRESSVVIGTVLGWRILREPLAGQRISASAVVTLGLILLAAAMRG
jgi:drug/metabolite transporter (DMT)-like permease